MEQNKDSFLLISPDIEVPRKMTTSSIIQITPIKNVVVEEVASPEEKE